MTSKKPTYIGIDVGGSKILLETFDASFQFISSKKVKTQTRKGKKGFLDQLYKLIDEFFVKDLKGIGIAVPGIVDHQKGLLMHAPHLPTGSNLKLKSLLEKRYKTRVHLDNDINAFLRAEYETARLKKYQNILAVMIGTGVGGAAIVNGKLLTGKSGFAGEFGHMVINQNGSLKTLEENMGGFYLPKIAKQLQISELKLKARDWKQVGALLQQDNRYAKKIQKHLVEELGIGLSNLNLIFNPDVIILGGSVYIYCLSGIRNRLESIVKKYSLDGRSPKLLTASSKTSVAKGSILLLNNKK